MPVEGLRPSAQMPVRLTPKHSRSVNDARSAYEKVNGWRFYRAQAKIVKTSVLTPIATVAMPTGRPLSSKVSQRADNASGMAMIVEKAPIPSIDPIPNSAT